MHRAKKFGELPYYHGCTTPMDLHEHFRRSIGVYHHNGRAFIGVCGLRGMFALCGSLTFEQIRAVICYDTLEHHRRCTRAFTASITYRDPRADCCLYQHNADGRTTSYRHRAHESFD